MDINELHLLIRHSNCHHTKYTIKLGYHHGSIRSCCKLVKQKHHLDPMNCMLKLLPCFSPRAFRLVSSVALFRVCCYPCKPKRQYSLQKICCMESFSSSYNSLVHIMFSYSILYFYLSVD